MGALAASHATKIGVNNAGEVIGMLHHYLDKFSKESQSYFGSAAGLIKSDGGQFVDHCSMKVKPDRSLASTLFIWQECRKWECKDS